MGPLLFPGCESLMEPVYKQVGFGGAVGFLISSHMRNTNDHADKKH